MSKETSRRKFLAAIGATGAAAAVGGAGTYAYITDENTATLDFQAGSIVLKIDPKVIDFTSATSDDSGTEDNEQDDGDEMLTTINIQNTGTLDVGQLRIDDVILSGDDDLKKAAEITTAEVTYPDGTTEDVLSNWEGAVDDFNSNGIFDMDDLRQHTEGALDIALLGAGHTLPKFANGTLKITLGVTFDYEQVTTNGGEFSADIVYEAIQEQ